jgi:hypothetical protein
VRFSPSSPPCPIAGAVDGISSKLADQVGSLNWFRLDPAAPGYGVTPLHFAPTPKSPWLDLFDPSVVEAHLDALEAAQADDGGWPIAWEALSPAAEAECRGVETLRALRLLRAFGRLG